jgi:O-acetyl-ADP-ribose deacetylase (regulator of RNase III)
LPVGQAIVAETGSKQFPFLITAPTMRIPGDVANSLNAYLAMCAILRAALNHPKISSVLCTGLCSLSGKMPLNIVARQMRAAYERVILKKFFYPHWIYEKQFERYLRCEITEPPDPDIYENKKV